MFLQVLPQKPTAKLRGDSSYLIVGGLGGIGASVCHFLANHRAKNLIVLSRSANAREKARSLFDKTEAIRSKIIGVGCDISNALSLEEALKTCAQEMPPIRGVVQGAMVLQLRIRIRTRVARLIHQQDSILEQMTLEKHNAATRPKVQGSWNLHQQLNGHNLDFLIMLSSLAGVVGFASQANYSAGGTFEDALARYRTARGLHGVLIVIGIVKQVGYVSGNDETAERLRKSGHTVLSEDDVLGAVESAITSGPSTQMVLGFNSGPGPHWEESGMARDLRFSSLYYRELGEKAAKVSKAGSNDIGSIISAAPSFDAAVDVIVTSITKKLMNIFMIAEAEIAPSNALSEYGVDSLVAVEMRNMLALRAGAEISIFDIIQSTSITALAVKVASKSSYIEPSFVSG